MPNTHRGQIKHVTDLASKFFPNALIYIPQINIPPTLSHTQQTSLDSLNLIIGQFTHNSHRLHNIPPLCPTKFTIDPKDTKFRVHWSPETANSMVSHWLDHLNL